MLIVEVSEMIKTSSYENFKSSLYKTVSISGDRGKGAGYTGVCYSQLAPKLSFWKKWHDNIGIISEEENNRYYIEEYYKQVLSKLNPEKVYEELDHSILLCYEDSDEFCHRHIVAAWFELLLNENVEEAIVEGYKIINREKPQYIKKILEEVIKKEKNMRGFTCLGALYLFEKSESLENQANKLEEETGKSYDNYRQVACYLRCEADEAEAEYIAKNKKSIR
jgi:uncharacterized protein (DUF488 family)